MHREGQEFMVRTDKLTHYNFGIGLIEATGEFTDEQIIEKTEASQKPIQAPEVVCIDARRSVGVLNSDMTIQRVERQPVREKDAGGILVTMFYSAKVSRWSGFTPEQLSGPIEEQIAVVADFMVDYAIANNEPIELGAHIATGADLKAGKTGCKAAEGIPQENQTISEHGNDDVFVAKMEADLGDNFNPYNLEQVVSNAGEDVKLDSYVGYNPVSFVDAILERGGVVEVLDSSNKRPDIDPVNVRHGHYEEAVRVNKRSGYSNDRDNPEIDFFQVDAAPIIRWSKRMAANENEFATMLHAAVAFQHAAESTITKDLANIVV